jgi:hypothetical protein
MMIVNGCDTAYEYIVFPKERVEYTLVPDGKMIAALQDDQYKLSEDKQTIIFSTKDYKIEIKYMTDYHLNVYEFPDQSQSQQYSTNPFTYGNWVDPELGYTPNRFTVFKVAIYNYAGGKINLDPENSFVRTDRGDELNCYAREEKNSRYHSLEAYFKKKKGTSGIDDDVFESRMGVVRRSVHYLGKPIFRGDVRDGLIVFDPLAEEVEQVKLTIKDFILGYDENNQASEYTTLNFYFRRTKFEPPVSSLSAAAGDSLRKKSGVQILDPSVRPTGELKIAVRTTNVLNADKLMKPLDDYFAENTNFRTSYIKTNLTPADLLSSNILMLIAEEGSIKFTADQERYAAEFIKRGGFIIADERSSTIQSENWQSINNFLTEATGQLGGNVTSGKIPSDHLIYKVWKKFDALPGVDAELQNVEGRILNDFLFGYYLDNRLVAVVSNRGYSVAWGEFNSPEMRTGKDFTRQRELLTNIFYYANASTKKE